MPRSAEDLQELAREGRRKPTLAEKALWSELNPKTRFGAKLGVLVERQAVLCGFIVDFYIPDWKLIIELDGGYHRERPQMRYDAWREETLCKAGYAIVRFANGAVEGFLYEAVEIIRSIGQIDPQVMRYGPGYFDGIPKVGPYLSHAEYIKSCW